MKPSQFHLARLGPDTEDYRAARLRHLPLRHPYCPGPVLALRGRPVEKCIVAVWPAAIDDTAAIDLRTPRGVPLDLALLQEFLKQTPKDRPLPLDWTKTFTFPVAR